MAMPQPEPNYTYPTAQHMEPKPHQSPDDDSRFINKFIKATDTISSVLDSKVANFVFDKVISRIPVVGALIATGKDALSMVVSGIGWLAKKLKNWCDKRNEQRAGLTGQLAQATDPKSKPPEPATVMAAIIPKNAIKDVTIQYLKAYDGAESYLRMSKEIIRQFTPAQFKQMLLAIQTLHQAKVIMANTYIRHADTVVALEQNPAVFRALLSDNVTKCEAVVTLAAQLPTPDLTQAMALDVAGKLMNAVDATPVNQSPTPFNRP